MARKNKLTKENKSKLRELAELDASVVEMAYYCDVTKQTVYNWFKQQPKFFDEIERLRAKPLFRVRKAINEKATESYANAMDYAKRKAPLEFGDNTHIQVTAPKPLLEMLHLEAKVVPDKQLKGGTDNSGTDKKNR